MAGSSEANSSGSMHGRKKVGVLFVCLGNICRSTMAEGVFRHLVKQHQPYKAKIEWKVDSCGTASYHVGDAPDSRTMWTLQEHGIKNYAHKGQCVRDLDTDGFDYIFAMDESNLASLHRMYGKDKRIMLFGQFQTVPQKDSKGHMIMDESPAIVDDPYYGSRGGFEETFQQCKQYSKNFLEYIADDLSKTEERVEFPEHLFT